MSPTGSAHPPGRPAADSVAEGPVVLLAGPGPTTNIVHRALLGAFPDVIAIIEKGVPRRQLARRRVVRLGYRAVAGQMLFMVLAVPLLTVQGRRRVGEILAAGGLDASPVPGAQDVDSVNSDAARHLLQRAQPAVVVVNGTRIIGKQTLGSVDAPFINMHAGLTPRYRGVHGGYWALADGRPDLVGTTIHLVDTGIDTGPPLAQVTFRVDGRDSFTTYPYLHVAAGLPLLVDCARALADGNPIERQVVDTGDDTSVLRHHPTLASYLVNRYRHGAR